MEKNKKKLKNIHLNVLEIFGYHFCTSDVYDHFEVENFNSLVCVTKASGVIRNQGEVHFTQKFLADTQQGKRRGGTQKGNM